MKVRIVFIVSILLLLVAAWWFFAVSPEMPEPEKTGETKTDFQVMEVKHFSLSDTVEVQGMVVPMKSVAVAFQVGGTLEKGELSLEKGTKFRKGQLLFQVNNREAFLLMVAAKRELKQNLETLLPQIKTQFPKELEKWNAFVAAIEPGSLLQELPEMKSKEELLFVKQHAIQESYSKIKSQESGMSAFFYLAPFDGGVTEIHFKAGQRVAKGQAVAQLSPKGSLQVKCVVEQAIFERFDADAQISIWDGERKTGAKIIKSLQQPQDAKFQEVYLSLNAWGNLKGGSTVTVRFSGKSNALYAKVPASAVHSGKVRILSGTNPVEQTISVIREEKDSLLITGLKNGDRLIVN